MTHESKNNLWKIIGIITLILIIISLAYFLYTRLTPFYNVDNTKFSYSVSPCNQEDKENFTNITINENYTAIHQKVSYVCCANITLRYEINESTLSVYEDNKGEICRCICNYEIKATIPAKGINEVKVYGVYYPDLHPYELLGESSIKIANPASVYCEEHEGRLEIRKDNESNEYGVCVFGDGSECEEWKFFRTECKKGERFCKDLCGDGTCQEVVCLAIGCPCAETLITCPQDCSLNCILAGKGKMPGDPKCCEGLDELLVYGTNSGVLDCSAAVISARICSDCGNDICGSGENKCNCPTDCS